MAAVDLFYERVLADALTRPFFERLNMEQQIKKQVAFMSRAFGGPTSHKERDLRAAHARLGLTDAHFDAVARHLHATLVELGVGQREIDEVMAIVDGTRPEILGR